MFLKRLLYYLNPATLFGKSNPDSSLRLCTASTASASCSSWCALRLWWCALSK
ncbi:MAG: hypothetical protein IPJ85_06505 [Flavobacteriales bacterium]|nr:hypothetical protein [Flavobacteriales bacterium]